MNFNSRNEASSMHISYQLLEKSRICGEATYGYNFHIFYLLLLQAPDQLKEKFGLKDRTFEVDLTCIRFNKKFYNNYGITIYYIFHRFYHSKAFKIPLIPNSVNLNVP